VKTKYYSFREFADLSRATGADGIGAEQLMTLYQAARDTDEPVVLELGVDRGASTTVFLQACSEKNGKLVSVDIRDCSDVSVDARWSFIQADSADVAGILARAPALEGGIDVLYIDSHHDWRHVSRELYGWFPYLNEGSTIFFDDVDPSSTRRGQRSDSITRERGYEQIHTFVQAFFLSNLDTTRLDVAYGSTGLARLRKHSPLGARPNPVDWSTMARRIDVLNMRYTFARALVWIRDRLRSGRRSP
jgi:predicted O-methyltransferase YrrM